MLLLQTQFLLGLSRDHGQNGSCWPSLYHCHIVVAVSQSFLLVQAAPRDSFQVQESRTCLERFFSLLHTLCLSLQTAHKDRTVSFCTGMGQQSPVGMWRCWHWHNRHWRLKGCLGVVLPRHNGIFQFFAVEKDGRGDAKQQQAMNGSDL